MVSGCGKKKILATASLTVAKYGSRGGMVDTASDDLATVDRVCGFESHREPECLCGGIGSHNTLKPCRL